MAALSANLTRIFSARPSPRTYIVKSGKTVYQGSLVGLEKATGHIVPLDDAADRAFIGVAQSKVVGDGVLTVGVWCIDAVLEKIAVTGLSGEALVGEVVYATTDNDLTLTRPADDAVPIGVTVRYHSSGIGDVALFGAEQASILALAGGAKKQIMLATVELANIIDTNVIKHVLYGHGKIVKIGAYALNPVTTAAKTTVLTGAIGGTGITTGALTLTSAGLTPDGAEQSVVPTALNEFFDGDVFTLTAGTTTAFVEGTAQIFIEVQYLP